MSNYSIEKIDKKNIKTTDILNSDLLKKLKLINFIDKLFTSVKNLLENKRVCAFHATTLRYQNDLRK